MTNGISGNGFITPMAIWQYQGADFFKVGSANQLAVPFSDVMRSAVQNVKTTQADVEEQQYLLATGQLQDAHSLPIAEAKAQVSLDLLIALRNKAMESYNELMKMSV